MRRLCVFCGSKPGGDSAFVASAERLGALLVERRVALVYGGGGRGLMGAIAQAVVERGGTVYGIIPQKLVGIEAAMDSGHLEIVGSMHERKARMAQLADGFVALPGGIGTLEELFEMWTWTQLGYHRKPCGVINVEGYFDPLIAFLDQMTDCGFVTRAQRDLLTVESSPERLLERWDT